PRGRPGGGPGGAAAPADPQLRGPGRGGAARHGDPRRPGARRGAARRGVRQGGGAGRHQGEVTTGRATMALFGSDFLQKLESLSVVSRRVCRGKLRGQRRTMQLGGGIEFAEHRDYTPGDDFRYLDWNVFARHDNLLLKRFQEEEDLHVYVLLDCSRSMDFGKPAKFDHARQVGAALAYIALADLDRVAVVAFAGDVVPASPLPRGRPRTVALRRSREELRRRGSLTALAGVAPGSAPRGQGRGLAIALSALYAPTGYGRGLDTPRHRRYEPHVIQVH